MQQQNRMGDMIQFTHTIGLTRTCKFGCCLLPWEQTIATKYLPPPQDRSSNGHIFMNSISCTMMQFECLQIKKKFKILKPVFIFRIFMLLHNSRYWEWSSWTFSLTIINKNDENKYFFFNLETGNVSKCENVVSSKCQDASLSALVQTHKGRVMKQLCMVE